MVLEALTPAVAELLVPASDPGLLRSVALLDSDDLLAEGGSGFADLCLLAAVTEPDAATWLEGLSEVEAGPGPRVILSKRAAGSARLRESALRLGLALVQVHPEARSEALLGTIRAILDRHRRSAATAPDGTPGIEADLSEMARTVAALTGGMVSIEDEHSHVLAYSAADDAADPLRILSILGREGPVDYLRRLREWGVFDRLRRTDAVVEVPADDELGLRRRLVVGIRATSVRSAGEQLLGTIWVQEGRTTLAVDARQVLQGAAAVAARLIARTRNAPSTEVVQVQRLLGLRGSGVDAPSLAADLGISTEGPAVVVGCRPREQVPPVELAELAAVLRLRAGSYARDSLVTTTSDRIYVLLPRVRTPAGLPAWLDGVLRQLEARVGHALNAAIAAPVADLGGLPLARSEVDRVLARAGDRRVTSLAEARTPVLLGEIVDLLRTRPELQDPRLDVLAAHDQRHHAALTASVEEYLAHLGDVRGAAAELHVHPNTLRYRLRRAADLLELDLDDPSDRLLLQLQLLARHRRPPG